MSEISFINRIEFDFSGSVVKKGIALGDVDNDGSNELVVGNDNGEVAIFKVRKNESYFIDNHWFLKLTCAFFF